MQSDLGSSPMSNECALLLSECEIPSLEVLSLSFCSIDDLGVCYLCKGKWENLKEINLGKRFDI